MSDLRRTKLWAQLATLVAVLCIAFMTWNHFVQANADWPDGHSWLKWNRARRVRYVLYYAQGVGDGYERGCRNAISAQNPDPTYDVFFKWTTLCNEQTPLSPKKDQIEYIDDITRFYERYPDSRGVRVGILLLGLNRGIPIDQLPKSHVSSY